MGDDGYHIFCKVKVKSKKLRALIDTGASKTVVGRKLFDLLKLENYVSNDSNLMTGIQPGDMDVSYAILNDLTIGTMVFKNSIVGIVDFEHVNKQYQSIGMQPFDLIIGGDILKRGQAMIDYKNSILKLSRK